MLSRNFSEVYKKGLLIMSDLYSRIDTLCKNENMSITAMCKESGASRASLSDLKVGRKQKLSTDTLSKIAKTLGVSVSFLLGDEPSWSAAVEKFGFCWEARFREDRKAEARAIMSDSSATDSNKYDAQIVIFKALFSRSLEASGYSLNHVDFKTYISMMLPQDQWKRNIPSTVYRKMVADYGTKPGIPQGTYYTVKEKAPDSIPGAERVDFSNYHEIPIIGRIPAGLPLYAEQNIEGYTITDLNGGAEYFALRVKGDSMNAIGINDGYVIIVRRQDEVENGEVAVVMVGDDDATVKRFYATDSTVTLMPQSSNRIHCPQIYDTKKTKIKILGKVVKVEFFL